MRKWSELAPNTEFFNEITSVSKIGEAIVISIHPRAFSLSILFKFWCKHVHSAFVVVRQVRWFVLNNFEMFGNAWLSKREIIGKFRDYRSCDLELINFLEVRNVKNLRAVYEEKKNGTYSEWRKSCLRVVSRSVYTHEYMNIYYGNIPNRHPGEGALPIHVFFYKKPFYKKIVLNSAKC